MMQKSPVSPQKSPISPQKILNSIARFVTPWIPCKNAPHHDAQKPYIIAIEPVSPQKSPVSANRALYPCSTWCTVRDVMVPMPHIMVPKSPIFRKRALYLCKRALYLCTRALYPCSTWCTVRDVIDYVTLCHTLYIQGSFAEI